MRFEPDTDLDDTMNALFKRLLLVFCLLPAMVQAATPAGQVMMLTGEASALGGDGSIRMLAKGQPVFSGELISTGMNSYINIRFADGGFFLLKPETRFGIEDFRQSAEAAVAAPANVTVAAPLPALATATPSAASGNSRAFFKLLKGGFRSVSGLVGKLNREDYRVTTAVATIGIRGTRFGGDLCTGACADRQEIDTQLRDTGSTPSEIVLVTTVEEGEISITTVQGTQTQGPGGARFVTESGTITPAARVPKSIEKEQVMQPEACGE